MAPITSAPVRLGRYQLRYRIAMGGMGGVYLAKATGAGGVDKVVAVKLIHEHMAEDQSVVKMFLDEARIASALNHVNVCSTFDFGEEEGRFFLVMEYLEGEPLNRVLKELGLGTDRHPLHPWLIARLLADAAEGLHAAHQLTGSDGQPLNVVHRDVSPHNIFVTYDGVAKVVDIGIARARERSSSTEAGAFKGKFEYAAPEQIAGGDNVDRRADVWALGVCLWELLTGKRLFARDEYSATVRAVIKEPIPIPSSVLPELPAELDEIAMRALERDPEKRFPTAREFARALRDALASSGESIDGPNIEEWLEALFPGDRAKRQALSTSVRQAGPDAPLEAVPAALKVNEGTGTGSKRNYGSQSGAGSKSGSGSKRNFNSSQMSLPKVRPKPAPDPQAGEATVPGPDPEAGEATRPPQEPPAQGRSLLLPAALFVGLLVVLGVGVAVLWKSPSVEPVEFVTPVEVSPTPPVAAVVPVIPREVVTPDAAVAVVVPATADVAVDAGVAFLAVVQKKPPKIPRVVPPVVPVKPQPVVPRPLPTARGSKTGGGMVHFKTPGGTAEVYIDGARVGSTPYSADLSPGKHNFELKVSGIEFGGPKALNISPGSELNVEVDLR